MNVIEREAQMTATTTSGQYRPTYAPRPVINPAPVKHSRTVVSRRASSKSKVNQIAAQAMVFVGLATCTYVISTLAGYVMLERASQATKAAADRATYARTEAKASRDHIEALTNPIRMRNWAASRHFLVGEEVKPTVPTSGGTRVAFR